MLCDIASSNRSTLALAIVACLCFHATARAGDLPATAAVPASDSATTTADGADAEAKTRSVRSGQRMTSLETVDVAATASTGGLMSPEDSDKAVSDLTAEAIRKMAPTTDPVQAMASMPGVYVSSPDPAGISSTTGFMVNGFNDSRLSYTLDGVPMNEAADYNIYPTFLGDAQNLVDINVAPGLSNIDAPSVSAEGGHISLITRQPSETAGAYVEQSFGSYATNKSFVRYDTGRIGRSRTWISLSHTRGDIWQGNGDQSSTRIQAKSVWDLSETSTLSFTAMRFNSSSDSFMSPTKAQFDSYGWKYGYNNDPTSSKYYRNNHGTSRITYLAADGEFRLSDRLNLSVIPYFYMAKQGGAYGTLPLSESTSGYYNLGHAIDLNGDGDTSDSVTSHLYVFSNIWRPGINTKLNWSGERNDVTAGVWYEKYRKSQPYGLSSTTSKSDRYRDSDGHYLNYENYYVESTSAKAYLADSFRIDDAWKLSGGVSYDYVRIEDYNGGSAVYASPNPTVVDQSVVVRQDYNSIQGDLGIAYAPDEHNSFYFHSSTGYRPPIAKVYYAYTAQNIDSLNRVEPETTWTNQLGWRYSDGGFMGSVSLQNIDYKNYQTQHYDENLQLEYFNAGEVKQYGLLSEASWSFAPHWSLYGSYSYLHSRQQDDFASTTSAGTVLLPTAGKAMAGIPEDMLALSLEYNLGNAYVHFGGKYNGSRYGDLLNTEKVGGYTLFDLGGGYTFSHGWGALHHPQLRLAVTNLFDKHYLGYVYSITTNANAYEGVSASSPTYLAGAPRYLMATMSFDIH